MNEYWTAEMSYYQGGKEVRRYGWFDCPQCHKKWESGNTYGIATKGNYKVRQNTLYIG